MSVVVLASAGGAPGTTTTALGLTLAWPRAVVLVDADPVPTQAILAGYLGGADPTGRGLSTYAVAAREHGPAGDVWSHCLQLGADSGKAVLAGFASPAAAAQFEPLWPTLLDAVGDSGADVIVDAGRVGGGLSRVLAQRADVVAVVLRSSLRSVVAHRLYLPGVRAQLESGHAVPHLVLVGPGRPYSAGEIGGVLGVEAVDEVPWDPERAAVLSDGVPGDRRFARSGLARAYVDLARRWAGAFTEPTGLAVAG